MTQEWASVIPFEDWSEGYANVLPMPPGPTDMPTVIPVSHGNPPTVPVSRYSYPMGVVILNSGSFPQGPPAELPLQWVDGDNVEVEFGTGDRTNGVVILFRGK